MKKKITKWILGSSTCVIALAMVVLISCLMLLDFFGANITDDYVEDNMKYAEKYTKVLNKHIKTGKGYVSLSRIIYFYLADDTLTFDEIYEDNLDADTKSQKPISEVCKMSKYVELSVCSIDELNESGQIDEEQLKPFNPPLDIANMSVSSFFKQERIVFGQPDVHEAWDFPSANDTPVFSVCDGTVKYVSFKNSKNVTNTKAGGGNMIKIECDVGEVTYDVLYAHLYPNSNKVHEGSKVKHWQHIAAVGTTGYSTGPHLHFQVSLDGKTIDGMSLIDFTYTK